MRFVRNSRQGLSWLSSITFQFGVQEGDRSCSKKMNVKVFANLKVKIQQGGEDVVTRICDACCWSRVLLNTNTCFWKGKSDWSLLVLDVCCRQEQENCFGEVLLHSSLNRLSSGSWNKWKRSRGNLRREELLWRRPFEEKQVSITAWSGFPCFLTKWLYSNP